MPTFISLCNFTEQGLREIKGSVMRADAIKKIMKEQFGVTMKDIYWTQGQYDFVVITEAQDEASGMAALLTVAKAGNVRSQTLRAFSAAEMSALMDRVA